MLVLASAEQMEAALAQVLVPVEVMQASPGFGGALARHEFGDDVVLVEGRSRPAVLARTPRLIDTAPSDALLLEINVRGRSVVSQHGRDAFLGAGDGALYDARRPYRLVFPEENSAFLVHIPREQLPYTDAVLHGATAQRIDTGLASYRLLRGYLDVVSALGAATAGQETGPLVRRTLTDLVCSIVSTLAGAGAGGSREMLLSALQVTVRSELSDPDLSPATLARRHHVSLRSVHTAFELTSTTPAAYIRDQRLRRARDLLSDARLRIIDVALASGFRGSTTFVRAFRAAYGMSPSAFRADPPL